MLRLSLLLLALLAPSCVGPDASHSGAGRAYVDERGLGLAGYDPVTYFAVGGLTPRRGQSEITATYDGVPYRFTGEANRRRFAADPERYAPAFGGWCAWGVTRGELTAPEPTSYLIEGGRLLLFSRTFFGDARSEWLERDGAELLARAEDAWIAGLGER